MAAEPVGAERFVLAYEGEESGRNVVRASEVGAPGIGPAHTVSDPGADSALGDLASGPRGEAVVSWVTGGGAAARFDRVAAAVRAPGEPSSRLRNRSPARSAPRGSTSRSTPRVGGCS